MNIPGDLVFRPYPGNWVQDAVSWARMLAVLLEHDIIFEGNGVSVVVTPTMTEDQCQRDFERAGKEKEREARERRAKREADER